jgi:hypothetical protein
MMDYRVRVEGQFLNFLVSGISVGHARSVLTRRLGKKMPRIAAEHLAATAELIEVRPWLLVLRTKQGRRKRALVWTDDSEEKIRKDLCKDYKIVEVYPV